MGLIFLTSRPTAMLTRRARENSDDGDRIMLPGALRATPLVCAVALVAVAVVALAAQPLAPNRPDRIVEQIQPGQPYLLLQRGLTSLLHPVELGDKSFVTVLVESNPVIFTGRVIRKEPAFIQRGTVVPLTEATWIGSRLTVLIERAIQTVDELPLMEGEQITFVWEHHGSAIINGTRVDAETLGLWPIEEGKRYLVAGRFMQIGRSTEKRLVAEMWLEPTDGAPLRGPGRRSLTPLVPGPPPTAPAPDGGLYETLPTFERDGPAPTDIYNIVYRLEQEVLKRKGGSDRTEERPPG
jgi:hypothetical protein